MTTLAVPDTIRFAIPKGRMKDEVIRLLADAGIDISESSRGYRPSISLDGYEVKVLKPRAIIEMLESGSRDLGFAGADWVTEHGADVVDLLDTGLDTVRLVAAAPAASLIDGRLPDRPLVVASEYSAIAERWIASKGLEASVMRSFGATEVLPPEDADCIIDNTASGSTLAANGLLIIDELMTSSTRLYASRSATDNPVKLAAIERFAMLVRSVLEARSRVMVEVNVSAADLDALIALLPCMREPTVSPLRSSSGFAVKSAVPRPMLADVIPLIKKCGGTDIIVTNPEQIIP